VEKSTSEVLRSNEIGRPLYCSLSCGAKDAHERRRNTNIESYNKNPNLCKCCKSPIPYEYRSINVFCSRSCAARINNKIVDAAKPKKYCPICSKQILRRNKYCTRACQAIAQIKDTEERIKLGKKVYISNVKRYIVKLRGSACEECGWNKKNPKSGKCTVQLEHVDGNAENNNLSNLKLLCPNCHSLTPTFGNLNRGNGRTWRYKK
jgi:hypothetical protein